MENLHFRRALGVDAQAVADLVNSGYRGDASRQGWTTEADYLVGKRTDTAEILRLLSDSDSMVLLCLEADEIIGSVHLQHEGSAAQLGMFVVKPTLQGQGIGKRFLDRAERTAASEWGVNRIQMHVITRRHELLAYYERRGYRRTGVLKPFPADDRRSTLTVPELKFEVLEKKC